MVFVGVHLELPLARSLVPEGLKSKAGRMDSLCGLERSTEGVSPVSVADGIDISDAVGNTKCGLAVTAASGPAADGWSTGGVTEGCRGIKTSAISIETLWEVLPY